MDVSKGCLALSDAKWEGPNISSASTPILIERGESSSNVCISTEFADLIEKSIPSFSYFGNESPRFFISTIKLANLLQVQPFLSCAARVAPPLFEATVA